MPRRIIFVLLGVGLGFGLLGCVSDLPVHKPWQAVDYYRQGVFYFTHQYFYRAQLEFQRALDQDPTFALAYSGLGYTFFMQGNVQCLERKVQECTRLHNQSALYFLTALRKDSSLEEAYYGLGQLMVFRWQLEKRDRLAQQAQSYLEEALKRNPARALTHYYLGLLEAYHQKRDQAVQELGTYLRLEPQAPDKTVVEHLLEALKTPALPLKKPDVFEENLLQNHKSQKDIMEVYPSSPDRSP